MKNILGYLKYVVVPGTWALENLAVADAVTNGAGGWNVFTIGVTFLGSLGASYLAFSGKW